MLIPNVKSVFTWPSQFPRFLRTNKLSPIKEEIWQLQETVGDMLGIGNVWKRTWSDLRFLFCFVTGCSKVQELSSVHEPAFVKQLNLNSVSIFARTRAERRKGGFPDNLRTYEIGRAHV